AAQASDNKVGIQEPAHGLHLIQSACGTYAASGGSDKALIVRQGAIESDPAWWIAVRQRSLFQGREDRGAVRLRRQSFLDPIGNGLVLAPRRFLNMPSKVIVQ